MSDQGVPLRSSSVDRRPVPTTSATIHRSSSISGSTNNRQFFDNRPGTSQSSYREKRYDPGRQQITIVETFTTTDGGFGRSNSTDGLSGQTWLQLQQQKLRAKKEQQQRDDRRYYEETIHTEIRNRPMRSRANVQRYDGYASDTAAFADEVDYRRPLHVQTPYQGNRSSDRNYHTITTTTSAVTLKERPFMTVKRAHEQAKREAVGSSLTILNASPNGHIAQAQTQAQNGLLSMAEQNRNGHVRLESDIITNANDDSNPTACTIVN